MIRRLVFRSLTAGAIVLCLAAGCRGGDSADDTPADTSSLILPAEPTVDIEFVENTSLELAGVTINPFDLESGDCFNEYVFRDRAGNLQRITTKVECLGPHDREVYFKIDHPADAESPFPGDAELRKWSQDKCLDAFEEFVNQEYVLSVLEIGVLQPTFETWNGAGVHRGVSCYLFPVDGGRLQGTMRNTAI